MDQADIDLDDLELDLDGIVATHGPFQLTTTGAFPTGEPTYAEWRAAVEWCQKVEKASQFWVGDLLAYGDKYGEIASQVLEATDYAMQTCANAKYTCNAIPPERRRASVPFSHHHEIAALPTVEEQDFWLNKCEVEDLTRDQLRVQIKAAKSAEAGHAVELWLLVKCADIDDQQKLADRMKLEGRSVKLQSKES